MLIVKVLHFKKCSGIIYPMKLPFRDHHTLLILETYEEQTLPLDAFLSNYFRLNKSVGSHDRKIIAETIYGIIRWQGLLDFLSTNNSWRDRLITYKNFNPTKYQDKPEIPSHIKVSFPKNYFNKLAAIYGEELAKKLCLISNSKAPVTIRANLLKISREELLIRLSKHYNVKLCPISKSGIYFIDKINFFALPEFKEGLFEIQDEGSQLIADLVQAKSSDQVFDFCAGAGGKTLAFAHKMQKGGQIYLHDVRQHALFDARKRLNRAGIQNAQFISHDKLPSQKIPPIDWLLLDLPCSGSGTLRRNPDLKWRFDEEMLTRLKEAQRTIFEESFKFVKKNGRIVYATCSIFPEENEEQIEFLTKKYNLSVEKKFYSLPQLDGMDGFFGCVLKVLN